MTQVTHHIIVNVAEQTLTLSDQSGTVKKYTIATAKNGIGFQYGSEQTPLGKHIIRAKIGADQPANTVFIRRRPTGEMYTEQLGAEHPGRDWMLTRILWLSGCEVGKNRLGNVDTMQRKIYIHGSPDSATLGVPSSRGCIRMANRDIIEFFNMVSAGTPVDIIEGK